MRESLPACASGTVKELIEEGKVKPFGLSEARRADDPPRKRGPASDDTSKRVLALVARAGGREPAHARAARHRVRAVQPAGKGVPDRRDRYEYRVRARRLP